MVINDGGRDKGSSRHFLSPLFARPAYLPLSPCLPSLLHQGASLLRILRTTLLRVSLVGVLPSAVSSAVRPSESFKYETSPRKKRPTVKWRRPERVRPVSLRPAAFQRWWWPQWP